MGQFEKGPPSLYCWPGDDILKQGDRWSFGWWTGEGGDKYSANCHVIFPDIKDRELEDCALSPVCKNRVLAVLAFVLKRILCRLDQNIRHVFNSSKS